MNEQTTELTMTTDCNFSLDTLTLEHGAHGDCYDGHTCLVEAANRAAYCLPDLRARFGAPDDFGDDHPSISRVVRSFAISWNDAFPGTPEGNAERTRLLKPFVTRILGTATTPEDEETRAWMATDWLCRVQTPAWLRLAGLTAEAQALESCARIVDAVTARAAQPALDDARAKSAAARAAAWAATGAAAWDAAGDAAWAAARAAAGDAAGAAACAAAWDAAGDAAGAAAGAAAGDAAWAAAWAAAGENLRPTVEALQASAVELLGAMCDVGRVEVAA